MTPVPIGEIPPVIILGGGLGTRLRSAVSERPKVLADVLGEPFLAHTLAMLAGQGVREVVVSAGHLGDQVSAFVRGRSDPSMRVRCILEDEPLGTAGALRFAARAAGITSAFVAMNGDTLLALPLDALVQAHRTAGATATLALAHVPDTSRYGRVETDPATGAVRAFHEKAAGAGPGWINAGVYVLEPTALAGVAPGEPASLERDVLPRLVGAGLFGRRFPGAPFLDIGTPEDFARAEAVVADLRKTPGPTPATDEAY